jgi:hypothetical protein
VSAAESAAEGSMLFIAVLFAVAVAVGAVIIYLGINGLIGGPIP